MQNTSQKNNTPTKKSRPHNIYNIYVTKYKRTKNLVKRCVDISEQCDLDIILIVRDKNTDRCREYHTNHEMTLPQLQNDMKSLKYERLFAGTDLPMES